MRIECEEDAEGLSDEVTGEESGEVTDEGNNSRLDSEGDTRIRLSTRERRSPDRYGTWIHLTDQVVQPSTVTEALSGADREKWKDAMDAEHKSLISNNVWELVELPKNASVVNCKWIFKHKIGVTGLVERYKARLVSQGYSQLPGIDYEETFSPVVRFESVRTVIALAVQDNLKLHQMDVTTAFLNGELKEQVYMK